MPYSDPESMARGELARALTLITGTTTEEMPGTSVEPNRITYMLLGMLSEPLTESKTGAEKQRAYFKLFWHFEIGADASSEDAACSRSYQLTKALKRYRPDNTHGFTDADCTAHPKRFTVETWDRALQATSGTVELTCSLEITVQWK